MLQQAAVQPALGAADAFAAMAVHEIGDGGACEAIHVVCAGRSIPEAQLLAKHSETVDQPAAGFAIGEFALPRSAKKKSSKRKGR